MAETKPNFDGLDLVRFAAAAMVMWYHLAWWSLANPNPLVATGARFPELTVTANYGGVGVEIFFVLSGFVIALTAEGRGASQFARSRFLRLYPAAWICATITLVALVAYAALTPLQLFAAWVRTLLIWPVGRKVDGVYWTLTVEMIFYALVWLLIVSRQWRHFDLFLIVLGLPASLFVLAGALGADLSWFYESMTARFTLLRHGHLFALGGLVWWWWKGRARLHHHGFTAFFLLTGAGSIWLSPDQAPAMATGVWLASVVAMLVAVRWHHLVRIPYARAIGLSTYPLYLLHNICGLAAMRIALDLGLGRHAALAFAVAVVIALSFLVALALEPALRSRVVGVMDWRPAFLKSGPATLP